MKKALLAPFLILAAAPGCMPGESAQPKGGLPVFSPSPLIIKMELSSASAPSWITYNMDHICAELKKDIIFPAEQKPTPALIPDASIKTRFAPSSGELIYDPGSDLPRGHTLHVEGRSSL